MAAPIVSSQTRGRVLATQSLRHRSVFWHSHSCASQDLTPDGLGVTSGATNTCRIAGTQGGADPNRNGLAAGQAGPTQPDARRNTAEMGPVNSAQLLLDVLRHRPVLSARQTVREEKRHDAREERQRDCPAGQPEERYHYNDGEDPHCRRQPQSIHKGHTSSVGHASDGCCSIRYCERCRPLAGKPGRRYPLERPYDRRTARATERRLL
jgi:hypothetical protein